MSKLYNIDVQEERFVLVGVSASDSDDMKESLEELRELVDTPGLYGRYDNPEQRKDSSSTYIGKGKIEEVRQMIFESDATGVVCDDELSPTA